MSVAICAGSLEAACSCDFTCFTINGDFGSGWCHVSFGMPVAPTLAPWGTIERCRGTLVHKMGDVGIQAWISVDFGWVSGPHFERLL